MSMIFTKEYERDVSLIIEGLWAQKLVSFLAEKIQIDPSSHEPFIIFYVTDENMQIWEHGEALAWYKNQLLKENRKGDAFIVEIVNQYNALLEKIEPVWNSGPISDHREIKKYMELAEQAISLFSIWYYTLTDKRTPKHILDLLLELRSSDEFFARNDVFIKSCVEALGGNKLLANLILPGEFPELPDEAVLQKRAKGIVCLDGKESYEMTLKEFAKNNPKYEFAGLIEKNDAKEVSGQIAYQGNANGLVRVVKNKQQMDAVKEGDILVSPMTTPDFLPAMKKAAAFVTDEGGITCHAAIVAREMKKPCIIGTKIATKVLKDGDLVEVDAEKGIVNVITA